MSGTEPIKSRWPAPSRSQDVPANLEPSLPDANADEPPVFVDGCLDSYTDTSLQPCTFGDTSSNTTVVLFGDSHAAMWFPAVDQAAQQFGWKLITWTKATCPPFPLPIFSPVLGRTFTECDEWRADVLDQIAAIHPALVILGVARHYTDIYNFTPYSPVWLVGPRPGGQRHPAARRPGDGLRPDPEAALRRPGVPLGPPDRRHRLHGAPRGRHQCRRHGGRKIGRHPERRELRGHRAVVLHRRRRVPSWWTTSSSTATTTI